MIYYLLFMIYDLLLKPQSWKLTANYLTNMLVSFAN